MDAVKYRQGESKDGYWHSIMQYKVHKDGSRSSHRGFVEKQRVEVGGKEKTEYGEIDQPQDLPEQVQYTSLRSHHGQTFPSQGVMQIPKDSPQPVLQVQLGQVRTFLPRYMVDPDYWQCAPPVTTSQQRSRMCPHYGTHQQRVWVKQHSCPSMYPYEVVGSQQEPPPPKFVLTQTEWKGAEFFITDIPRATVLKVLGSMFQLDITDLNSMKPALISIGIRRQQEPEHSSINVLPINFPWFQATPCQTAQNTVHKHCHAPLTVSSLDVTALRSINNIPCVRPVSQKQYTVLRRAHEVMMRHLETYKGDQHLIKGKKQFDSLQRTFKNCLVYPVRFSSNKIHTNMDELVQEKIQTRLVTIKDKKNLQEVKTEQEHTRAQAKQWNQQHLMAPYKSDQRDTLVKDSSVYEWVHQTVSVKEVVRSAVTSIIQDMPALQLDLSAVLKYSSSMKGVLTLIGRSKKIQQGRVRQELRSLKKEFLGCVYSVTASAPQPITGVLHSNVREAREKKPNESARKSYSLKTDDVEGPSLEQNNPIRPSFSRNMPSRAIWYSEHSYYQPAAAETAATFYNDARCDEEAVYSEPILPVHIG